MNNTISDLPDFASLKKLAAVLWQQDNSYYGAAVMVGAGFSRCAASTGDINRKLPLWKELSETLAKELDSDNHTDPLRLLTINAAELPLSASAIAYSQLSADRQSMWHEEIGNNTLKPALRCIHKSVDQC